MDQLTTLKQAKEVAANLGTIGGGVLPYRPDVSIEQMPPDREDIPQSSGIYIPAYYSGPFATPGDGDYKFYHLRFANGSDGHNAGLVIDLMRRFPTRWAAMLAEEVNAASKR